MKKLLAIVFTGLFLGSCVTDNVAEFKKLSKDEWKIIWENRDARLNIFEGDKDLVYVGLGDARLAYKIGAMDPAQYLIAQNIATITCMKKLKLNTADKIATKLMTKEETKKYKLWMTVYDVFQCK